MGIPYGRLVLAAAAAGALAFAYLPSPKFPDLSLEHLSSPYVKVLRLGVNPGHGSGTYLGNGLILTANHIIKDETELEVLTEDGKRFPAKIKATSIQADMAILRIDPLAAIKARKVACREVRVGEPIQVTGNPFSLEFIKLWGKIAGKPRPLSIGDVELTGLMILDMTVTPGVSGAGVMDQFGKIIGIITATLTFKEVPLPVVFSVPSSVFCPILKDVGAL